MLDPLPYKNYFINISLSNLNFNLVVVLERLLFFEYTYKLSDDLITQPSYFSYKNYELYYYNYYSFLTINVSITFNVFNFYYLIIFYINFNYSNLY